LNIRANPRVRLRLRGGTFAGIARELEEGPQKEQAREAYCETVHPFDYLECDFHLGGRATRAKIKQLHRHWFETGVPLVVELADDAIELSSIGRVESALTDLAAAPNQGDEGAPEARLVLVPGVLEALDGIAPGDRIIVLTWLDRARRDVLRVHPRGDPANPMQGVFATRSPDRPNPIGLHEVDVLAVDGASLRVRPLEAVHGTPIVDIKPVLTPRD
jgi:tRNA-Thr(GGU) m(6)t(6)A37 methyltransferase TsaA